MKRLVVAIAMAAAALAAAAEYPDRPIHISLPYTPGGVTDVVVRQLGHSLEADLKQSVIVDNKPGANGTLGATMLVGAPPDGYQLSIVPIGIFRQPLIQKMTLDPMKHLTYIASLVDYSYVIAVRQDAPWKSVPEFISSMKTAKNCTYGTPGVYSSPQLAMADFAKAAGFECTHIPYKGASEATAALLGGQMDAMVGSGGGSLDAFVDNHQLRLLATLGNERAERYPDVPTLKESGIPVVIAAPFGLVGPAGMDPQVVDKLASSIHKAMSDPAMVELVRKNSAVVQFMGPKDYTAYASRTWAAEKVRFAKLGETPR